MRIKGRAGSAALSAALALLSAACHAPPPRPAASSGATPPAASAPGSSAPAPMPAQHGRPPPAAANGALFHIDGARSELRILVYRSGPMAALGHNHVIANRQLRGWVRYADTIEGGRFMLEVPVAGFSVDEPALRNAAGKDFSDQVSEEARRGTRENMLSAAQLDAAAHPLIRVRSDALSGTAPHLTATVTIEVAGHASQQLVPFDLSIMPDALRAHAALELRQSALGLTPFSIFLGALRVEDRMRVEFDLTAKRGDPDRPAER